MLLRISLIVAMLSWFALAQELDPAKLSQPTSITLKLPQVSQKQLFDELAKDANVTFATLPANLFEKAPGKPVTVDWNKVPFWSAMRDACAQAQISLKHATDTDKPTIILSRDNSEWTTYPAVASGPFLVNLIGLHRSSTIDMRKPGDVQRQFYAKFTIFCEPRIKLLRASLVAKVEAAADDKGAKLAAEKVDTDAMNFVSSWVHNLEARLTYPKEAGTKIPLLKCSAKFIVQTASESLTFNDPLEKKNQSTTIAGRKITLQELRRGTSEWEAVVTFARQKDLPAADWEASLFPGHTLKITDTLGQSLVARGYGLGGKSDVGTFIFKFEKEPAKGPRMGKPIKLTWEIPTQTTTLPLTWEFKDVPLP